ncbi:IDEAL domain-containing protein [Bacillus tianshenii]|nr:IDEAL domain-containing protein [Bacillus tianshenii]
MNYKKSFPEQQTGAQQHISSVEMEIYIQMILDEAALLYKRNQLEMQIDKALDNSDKETFMELTKEYKEVRAKLA